MIYIGTSGFQYDDWGSVYYPDGLPQENRLAFYAQEFRALEINFTYYRMPTARGLAGMARHVPDDFRFTIKATQDLTHGRTRDAHLAQQFIDALTPLREQNKLGAVLAQFPKSFRANDASREYLKWLRAALNGLPVVIEFRNKEWLTAETYAMLREHALGFCCVDEPYFPRVAEITSAIAYVRFHGRNFQKWWKHEHAWERYDYTYSTNELQEWTPKIEALNARAEITFVFANNHYRAQGIDTARQLKMLLPNAV